MKNIVIIGSGGLAKEVAFLIEDINKNKMEWNLEGFIANDYTEALENNKYNIIGNDKWLIEQTRDLYVVFGIGSPQLIEKLAEKYLKNTSLKFPNLIHPNVVGDWDNILLGRGNIICAGNIFTTMISIGSFNYFNLSCTVGHDTTFGNFNIINPSANISGGVCINNSILIGTGTQILQYKSLCDNCIVGAGSVVARDLEVRGTYIGIPAKIIHKDES